MATESEKVFYCALLEFVGVRDILCGALLGCRVSSEVCSLLYVLFANVHNSICPMLWLFHFSVRDLSGHVFVLDLTPGSQADFDKFICRGDVIDGLMERHRGIPKVGRYPSMCRLQNILHLYKHL